MKKRLNAYEITLVALLKADLEEKAAKYYENGKDRMSEDFIYYARQALREIEREERMKYDEQRWEEKTKKREREEWFYFV